MKLIRTLKKSPITLCMLLLFMQSTTAQVCSNPAGIIYGLDNNGGIFPITVATAAVGARINPAYPGNPAMASNAIGYNATNNRFYYFKRNADNAPQEFVSFDPVTNAYSILASCPTTNNIRTGCVNASGTGYYCIDATAKLYFYRFTSNNWKVITGTYFNQFGANVTAAIAAHSSGDIAMDGWGDLWYLCSDPASYGLYYFRGQLPVNPVASMNLVERIPPTTPTPLGTNFAGIGFSPTGQIYISQSGDRLYRMNNDESLTLLGTFTTPGVGGDLTSCVFPMMALAIDQRDLTVQSIGGQQILLTWNRQDQNVQGFFVESSIDGEKWITLGYVENNNTQTSNTKYTFTEQAPTSGRHYYRIKQVGYEGQSVYSEVKIIDVKISNLISITPNPTKGNMQVNNSMNTFSRISIVDISGKILKELQLRKGLNSIALTSYPSGTYIIRLLADNGQVHFEKIIKE